MGCDDLELWCSKEAQCNDRASFSFWLYRFSIVVIVRVMKWTGWRPLPVSWNNPAESPSWKLASTLTTTIGLAGLKYAIVLSLGTLAFSFSNASFSSAPRLNFVSLWVSFRKGVVSDAYLGMNFDRYPVMPRKRFTASFDFGGLLSFTALVFSRFGFNQSFVNLCPKNSISSTLN